MVALLVTYGAWVWKIAALVVALLGLLIVRLVRGRRAHARIRSDMAARTGKVTAPVLAKAQGEVVVNGVLHGGMATTLTIGSNAYHERAGELWIDYKGERLELGGPACVVHGTTETVSRGLPRTTPRGIRDAIARGADSGSRVSQLVRRAAGGRVHRLTRLQDGDLVIVRGLLGGQTAGVDRFGVRSWILEPLPETREIEVVAVSPKATAVPMRGIAALALAAAFAGAACGGMYALGRHELAGSRSTTALAIAAAMPLARGEAIAELARRGIAPR